MPENSHLIGGLTASTTIPVATGSGSTAGRSSSRSSRRASPSRSRTSRTPHGITEVRKIASLAEIYDVQLAPHCPLGPLALAACLQVGFATPNFLIQEQSIGIHYNQGAEVLDYVLDKTPLKFVDGFVERLTAPGLGIEIDEAAVRRADRSGHAWRSPVWRHDDGAYAEW